jgi:hypothetical protein
MSLGLPEFGSRGRGDEARGIWRGVQVVGLMVLAYVLAVAATEGWAAYSEDRSMQKAAAEVSALAQSADAARRALLKSPELLTAASSVESSPERVIADLKEVLPGGVSLVSYKIDYQPEIPARVELGVVAQGPAAYDRFLSALSKSKRFGDLRPGSESRPGLVKAVVVVFHYPRGTGK